jgi:hypothetical protein
MSMSKRFWAIVVIAFVVTAMLSALTAIWSYDWRWGATGGVMLVGAWFSVFGLMTGR